MNKPRSSSVLKSRPKVLVLGNGVLRAWGGRNCAKLEELIYHVSDDKPDIVKSKCISFPMRIAASFARSADCHHGVEKAVGGLFASGKLELDVAKDLLCHHDEELTSVLEKLLKAGFDDIITTNYGYEIEQVLLGESPSPQDVKTSRGQKGDFYRRYKYAKKMSPRERIPTEQKFKIRRCYRDAVTGTRIWHVHGEYLRPWSIVFGNYEYCSLLAKVKEQCSVAGFKARYGRYGEDEDFELATSWVDSFLFGDVYMLGFGAAPDESVFWWLMERKKRMERKSGSVYFYEPTFSGSADEQFKKDVAELIGAFGGEHRSKEVNISNPEKEKAKFCKFYKKAIDEIVGAVNGTINLCERK